MSLFFTEYLCLGCSRRWICQGGIVGTRSMGEPLKNCPNCQGTSFSTRPYNFGQNSQFLPQAFPQPNLSIKVYRATPTAKLPTKAYDDDSGFDVYADGTDSVFVYPHRTERISTGLHVELPKGWGAVMKPRSSQGSGNIDIFAGVEDNGYRGVWVVCVHNASSHFPLEIKPGDKIGQFILHPVPKCDIVEVQSLGQLSQTQRGQKGFGSTGK